MAGTISIAARWEVDDVCNGMQSSGAQIAGASSQVRLNFVTMVPNICGYSEWNLLHVILLAPRIVKRLPQFFLKSLFTPDVEWICGPFSLLSRCRSFKVTTDFHLFYCYLTTLSIDNIQTPKRWWMNACMSDWECGVLVKWYWQM